MHACVYSEMVDGQVWHYVVNGVVACRSRELARLTSVLPVHAAGNGHEIVSADAVWSLIMNCRLWASDAQVCIIGLTWNVVRSFECPWWLAACCVTF